MRKVILLGLNEINFDFIDSYIKKGYLPAFKEVFEKHGYTQTVSESKYELLEPWIQWVSIHTGKTYDEHKVFRLGDIEQRSDLKQLWEIAEENGLSVAAISPFNAKNNLLHSPFFVPDPWTKTKTSGNSLIQRISTAISSSVNNNANEKISKSSILYIMAAFVRYVKPREYSKYLKQVLFNRRSKATKPVILDNLLSDVFLTLWKTHKPDFSSLFLNSGAHIQHHYLFNSAVYEGNLRNPEWYCPPEDDPLLTILTAYDHILKRLMQLDCRVFIATGLHQVPHSESTYYWRLKSHADFLKRIGVPEYKNVMPRMSRDFLVECNTSGEAIIIEKKLASISLKGKEVFTIDNRGESLFIELTYEDNIKDGAYIFSDQNDLGIDLFDFVSFVAIKNGEHNGIGYFIDTDKKFDKNELIKVTDIFSLIKGTFVKN